MKKANVVVIGSSNTDMVVQLPHLPSAGQTLLGDQFVKHHGGKGANQAVAAARAGGEVSFIACMGSDSFGDDAILGFQEDGINVAHIKRTTEAPSGVALILVAPDGENMIGVALGANGHLNPDDIVANETLIANADSILMQLETPLETITACVELANKYPCRVILNPAPAQTLPQTLLQQIDILTPNESEAEVLTGISVTDAASAQQAAQNLREQGVKIVIITLGEQGAYYLSENEAGMIPGFRVDAVDSTAAGDTFNGALSVALAEGKALAEAIRIANAAGALSVTKVGAQPSIPSFSEVGALLA